MPEIGDQLRETRLRNRIDITDVEAATKIRAKYLRALENEEWELLPGPTFVKTFLRTYADYLGLDARNLVEEYRGRYERPATQDLTPFAAGRRARPRRPVFAPWMAVVVGIAALIAALYLLGTWGGDPDEQEAGRPEATPSPAAQPEEEGDGEEREERRRPRRVRLQIQPTGPVSVCLENGGGKVLITEADLPRVLESLAEPPVAASVEE